MLDGFIATEAHHSSCSLVELNIKLLVKLCYLVLLRPLCRVGELSKCTCNVEFSCPKVTTGLLVSSRKGIGQSLTEVSGHRDLGLGLAILAGRDPSREGLI